MARILYVSEGYSSHDRRFLERLAELAHEVWYLPCSADAMRHEVRPLPLGIYALAPLIRKNISPGTLAWIRAAVRFRSVIRQMQPDLVHAGPVQKGGFFAALAGSHPLLVMSWGSDVLADANESWWMRWVTRFTLRRADVALADCEAVRERITSLASLPADRIITFPWGIDQSHFHPKVSQLGLRKRFGWEECRVIVSARSLELVHGTIVFLEAIRRVLHQRDDVRVLMLGEGTLRTQVETFIRAHRLAEKIHLAGAVPEDLLPAHFAEADLYVSAAPCDGSSISLLQAMGCGLPVIVTNAYGNREWVQHEKNGWLCPAGNEQALASAILEALQDNDARLAMSQANADLVRARANWNVNFQKLLSAYHKLRFNVASSEVESHVLFSNR